MAAKALVEWAQAAGHAKTALNLAEASAAFAPNDSHAAFIAARTNRQLGDAWRAEVFYRRAILSAFRQQEWKDYICSQLGLGTLLLDRGDWSDAAKHYETAARVAGDQGIEWLAAQTFHDLAGLHFQRGHVQAAIKAVRTAIAIYPRHNERLPIAVHDLAFLHVLEGHHAAALPLLQMLMPMPLLPHDQVLVAGTLARAAGALGLSHHFDEASARVIKLSPLHAHHADAAFVNLAYGARALGHWALAAEQAAHGARLAADANHAFVEQAAWTLLQDIAAKKPSPTPVLLRGVEATDLEKLAGSLSQNLGGWRRTWTRDQSGPGKLDPSHC